jgi:putative glutamine amidotransferase
VIGVTACLKAIDGVPFHAAGEQYVRAVRDGADAVPLILPALGDDLDLDTVLETVDGLLFTGSPSNVAPEHYGGPPPREGNLADPARDATTLPLWRKALHRNLPILAICRGMQELNVALGGTLHQHVQEVAGRFDHRAPPRDRPIEVRYGPAHAVRVQPGGMLERILEGETQFIVNSLHGQGIDRLASGLVVEATAEDGTIEAVSVAGAGAFVIAVQWHPEYKVLENPQSRRLFAAFGAACRGRTKLRQDHERPGVVA